MKALSRCVLVGGTVLGVLASGVGAQQQQGEPAQPSLSPGAQSALNALSSQFAAQVELHQAWFRDRPLLYYDFGTVGSPIAPGRVLWPIHGFDAAGNPVAIRGQLPIFSSLPGMGGYSGVWHLSYVVTADHAKPNQLRSPADVDAMVRRNRASIRETKLVLNLPVAPRGSRLARDTMPAMAAWYEGHEVQYFDFGETSVTPAPMLVFAHGQDSTGKPDYFREQGNIADTIPSVPAFPDLWSVELVHVDSAYAANTLKSISAVRSSGFMISPASALRNCPVVFVDAAKVERAPSPLRAFADLRSGMQPAPTLQVSAPPASTPPAPTPPQ